MTPNTHDKIDYLLRHTAEMDQAEAAAWASENIEGFQEIANAEGVAVESAVVIIRGLSE